MTGIVEQKVPLTELEPKTETNEVTQQPPTEGKPEIYQSKEFVQRTIGEAREAKERARLAEERLKTLEEQKLKETEDWKALAEKREQEVIDYKKQVNDFETKSVENNKRNAIKDELTKRGCDPNLIDELTRLVDLTKIEYHNEAGICTGQEDVATEMSGKFAKLFGGNPVGVNSAAPVGQPHKLTTEAWKDLPPKEKAERYGELRESLGFPLKK